MTEQRPDVPTDHEPALIAEPFLRYYEGHLRSEEAREAFTRGGELGYRRYIFEHLYSEMQRMYGEEFLHYGRPDVAAGGVVWELAPPGAGRGREGTFIQRVANPIHALAARDVTKDTGEAAPQDGSFLVMPSPSAAGGLPPRQGDRGAAVSRLAPPDTAGEKTEDTADNEVRADDFDEGAAQTTVPMPPDPDTEEAAPADNPGPGIPDWPSADSVTNPLGAPVAAGAGASRVMPGMAGPARGATATAVAPMPGPVGTVGGPGLQVAREELVRAVVARRSSVNTELAQNLPVDRRERMRMLGRRVVNLVQYFRGRGELHAYEQALETYQQAFAAQLNTLDPGLRNDARGDEMATFDAAVERRWLLSIGADNPSRIPPHHSKGVREATNWLQQEGVWRVGRISVRRAVVVPAVLGGAVLGIGTGLIIGAGVLGAPLWLAGAAGAAAWGYGWGKSRVIRVNRYQIAVDDFRSNLADTIRNRRDNLAASIQADTGGETMAAQAVSEYETTTRELTQRNLARLLGAEAVGIMAAEAGFVTGGLVEEGVRLLAGQAHAGLPHNKGETPTPSPHHTPTPTPNTGNVNIHGSPWDVARQLGSSNPEQAIQNVIAQYNMQPGAHHLALVNGAFGVPGEQIVDQTTNGLLSPSQQAAFNQFMANLAHAKPGVLDP